MNIPLTSISLGFHAQMDPWRKALHLDPKGTFETFGITESTYRILLEGNQNDGSQHVGTKLTVAQAMLDKAIAIEELSARIVAGGGDKPNEELAKLIEEFLLMAASWVAAEVALGLPFPDQPVVDEPGDLIRRMYLLIYSSAFRANPDRGSFDEPAWNAVLAAVKAGGGKFDQLLPHCETLCAAVAHEFINLLWPFIW